MGWKDWSYWVKGGVIGFVIGFIIALIAMILLSPLCTLSGQCDLISLIIKIIFGAIVYSIPFIIIGFVVGIVIQKIKSRKKEE